MNDSEMGKAVETAVARALAAVEVEGNGFGGADYEPASKGGYPGASFVRVWPVDMGWANGFNVTVFDHRGVVLGRANVGTTTPTVAARVAVALWNN